MSAQHQSIPFNSSEQVSQGRILMLPRQRRRPAAPIQVCRYNARSDYLSEASLQIFNHPVIVISRPWDCPQFAYILIVTSFRNRHVSEAFKFGRPNSLADYVAITPAEHDRSVRGIHDYLPLALAGGASMSLRSYINAKDVYLVSWQDLEHFYGSVPSVRMSLEQTSLQRLLTVTEARSGYVPGWQYMEPSPFVLWPPLFLNLWFYAEQIRAYLWAHEVAAQTSIAEYPHSAPSSTSA